MATVEQLADLRLLIAEPTETIYTEAALSDRIDAAAGDLNVVAHRIWGEKAARFAVLVDTTEGGSSRRNGQLLDQALKMVSHLERFLPDTAGGERTGTRIKRLTR